MAARVERPEPPLVVIVGPTASGKTALAIELAKEYAGEIICADSRTVYSGMDIGTAKPTREERAIVPHWGLDLVEPGQRFTAADFKRYALAKIDEIRSRGHTPFLVGGTGLYVDAVLFDYRFGSDIQPEVRAQLEQLTVEQLQKYCIENNIQLPKNQHNKRHLIRAIEQGGANHKRNTDILPNTIVVGITTDRDTLRQRIEARTEQLFANGVVEEAKTLGKKYGWDSEAMTGNIYPIVHRYLLGESTLHEAKQVFATKDWQLAKRQLTWLRRNPYICWLLLKDAEHYIAAQLFDTQQKCATV